MAMSMFEVSAGVPLPLEGRVAAQRPGGVSAAVLDIFFARKVSR
jgi:hypothetical protein